MSKQSTEVLGPPTVSLGIVLAVPQPAKTDLVQRIHDHQPDSVLLREARDLIYAPRPTSGDKMEKACQTVLELSRDAMDRTAATEILRVRKAAQS